MFNLCNDYIVTNSNSIQTKKYSFFLNVKKKLFSKFYTEFFTFSVFIILIVFLQNNWKLGNTRCVYKN